MTTDQVLVFDWITGSTQVNSPQNKRGFILRALSVARDGDLILVILFISVHATPLLPLATLAYEHPETRLVILCIFMTGVIVYNQPTLRIGWGPGWSAWVMEFLRPEQCSAPFTTRLCCCIIWYAYYNAFSCNSKLLQCYTL